MLFGTFLLSLPHNLLLTFKMDKYINRIKVVLAEKKRTNKWLAEQLGKDPATISKWCTNACQPPMETYMRIAKLLDVDLKELVRFEEIDNN
jgi:transcriptional regulator with XRE-family HTH domain